MQKALKGNSKAWRAVSETERPRTAGTTYEMTARASTKIRASRVARKMAEKGWGLRRLELRRERLEDTFMKVAYQRA